MTTEELLKIAAEPTLIASAAKANELLGRLNAVISDLRQEVRELELGSDLHRNKLLQQTDKSIALKESEYRISEPYKEFRKQAGQLSDVRAIRKALQRHADLLYDQEKYSQRYGNYPKVID